MLGHIALFYLVGAVIFGLVAASSAHVNARVGVRQLPYPRLIASLAIGIFWPVALWNLVFGR